MAIDKILGNGDLDSVADSVFSAVSNSVSEVKAMQQRKAAENVQLVVESLKKIDTDIRVKFDNVSNALEKRIITIQDGRDGSNGSDGRDGKDGRNGKDGLNGKQGVPGAPGRDGVDGEDGVSVVDARIDFDGSLIIDLSTGRAINVGEVVSQNLEERIKVITSGGAGGGGGSGTVSSVAGTGTVNGITLTGTVTTAGSLTLGGTLSGVNLATQVTGTLPVANGGTGTATPGLVQGTNITITGTWPNQTINASGSGAATPIIENENTIATNKTITAGSNGISVGSMTINTGVTVTVGANQRYVVL